MSDARPTISVLIPSFGRPARLAACLQSLERQTVRPNEVLVVWQAEDVATRDTAEDLARTLSYPIVVLHSPEPGVVPAENLALDRSTSEIIALIDDDAVAPPGWIERYLAFYSDPSVGAVGGPADNHYTDNRKFDPVDREPIGKLTWFGRAHGNMHTHPESWRSRPTIEVDSLVGYNMTLRRKAFDRFEAGLRRYWQSFEVEACLQVKARGYRALFDFGNVVDHFPTNPTYGPGRDGDLQVKIYNGAFNQAFVLAKHSPLRLCAARLFYLLAIGSTAYPGLMASFVGWRRYGHLRREAAILWRTWGATLAGWRAGAKKRDK